MPNTKALSGFADYLPAEQIILDQFKQQIADTFKLYGFIPLDLPIIERAETLLAKAGGETEKQIYRFMKGDNDLALRFDLTVPLARYVADHYGDLTFPFRRFHIGKSYRGERPQRGRFREFYQADIDIIGDGELSVMNEAELPAIIYRIFIALGIDDFTIRLNNRKILQGLFEELNIDLHPLEIIRIIDKLDKIGADAVRKAIQELKVSSEKTDRIMEFVDIKGANNEIITALENLDIKSATFQTGVAELKSVVNNLSFLGVPNNYYKIDLAIARGLDYYTGTVYETVLNQHTDLGSVCSGGRYENLASTYTKQHLPGVGISIGLTRLLFQLNEAGIIPKSAPSITQVMIAPMIDDLSVPFELATKLRQASIKTEVYLEDHKFKKKMNYANKLQIPYVIIVGEDEIKSGKFALKNMESGEQAMLSIQEIINKFST